MSPVSRTPVYGSYTVIAAGWWPGEPSTSSTRPPRSKETLRSGHPSPNPWIQLTSSDPVTGAPPAKSVMASFWLSYPADKMSA